MTLAREDSRGPLRPVLGRLSRAHWTGGFSLLLALGLSGIGPAWATVPLVGFLALCLTAPYFPRWSFFLPIASAGPRTVSAVALTFDDGPDPASTPPLLRTLARHGVKATFFVIGDRAEAHPELIGAILSQGHEVGNHSLRHDVFLMLRSYSVLQAEVSGCQEVLRRFGVHALAFRPPVGITNSRLRSVLEREEMFCAGFSCRPADFGNRRVAGLADRVLRKARPGDIVLLHDRSPSGGVEPWLEEIEAIVRRFQERGLGMVPLSELLGRPVMERTGQGEG